MANKNRNCYTASVDEGRKRVIGIMAAILAARKLAQYDPVRSVPATMSAISGRGDVGGRDSEGD